MLLHRIRDHTFALVVVALLVAAEVAVLGGLNADDRLLAGVFAPAWTLPLLARRRWPAATALTVAGVLALEAQVVQPATESVVVLPVVMLLFWIAGSISERLLAVVVGVACAVLAVVVVAANPGPFGAGDATFLLVFTAAPFAAGVAMREREERTAALQARADDLERRREERARAAVLDERARIARELHDVVGHSISVMMLQTGAARLLVDSDPERTRAALLTAEEAGRGALEEMRRMLEVLRDGSAPTELDPQPGLADLPDLVTQVRDAGLPVELAVEGPVEPLRPGVDLAAYRIVQEALTNVRKHAGAARTVVRLRYGDRELDIAVENDGPPVVDASSDGHGLVGMRERVALYHGQLAVGPRPAGGFSVRARLPFEPGPS